MCARFVPRPVGGCRTRVIATRNPAFGRAGLHNQGERAVLNDQILIAGPVAIGIATIVALIVQVIRDAEDVDEDEDYWDR